MARSTCNPNREVPDGMMRFEVIRSTIKDNVGQYCVPGDKAILDPPTAKFYLEQNYIRVPLPEGFGESAELDEADQLLHEIGHTEPALKGRAEARKREIAEQRAEREAADAAAAEERQRLKDELLGDIKSTAASIIEDAKREAAAIVAAARDSAGPAGESDTTDEPVPDTGDSGVSDDSAGENTAKRSEVKADPKPPAGQRRRRRPADA